MKTKGAAKDSLCKGEPAFSIAMKTFVTFLSVIYLASLVLFPKLGHGLVFFPPINIFRICFYLLDKNNLLLL
ncbi:hypothetical protein K737_300853 [Holospora undulata HU1]|uniref:Uncharacterized protein n=1 Tax=Holospora undulata HU1 TaxID=1321371 RepID=A0A061JHD4_9PROT|nr:hypothetical protein K737_300853 [Holospora undulata HU1]